MFIFYFFIKFGVFGSWVVGDGGVVRIFFSGVGFFGGFAGRRGCSYFFYIYF